MVNLVELVPLENPSGQLSSYAMQILITILMEPHVISKVINKIYTSASVILFYETSPIWYSDFNLVVTFLIAFRDINGMSKVIHST